MYLYQQLHVRSSLLWMKTHGFTDSVRIQSKLKPKCGVKPVELL
jgi:hypothetical protein